MEFRPCIDIHNGKVKQIVGGSLKDEGNFAKENFVSSQDAAFYARLYQKDGIKGGHIIMLNHKDIFRGASGRGRNPCQKCRRIFSGGCQSCDCDFLCVSEWIRQL